VDFSLTEEQEAVRGLAEQIFQGSVTVERVKEIEAGEGRIDRDLWKALGDAGLLGIALPESVDGQGLGMIETALVLEQQGRVVAPVPYWASIVCGALPIAEFGTDEQKTKWLPGVVQGETFLTAALAEPGVNDALHPLVQATATGDTYTLDGVKPAVPSAHAAAAILVPAQQEDGSPAVFIVDGDAPGLHAEPGEATDRSLVGHLTFDGTPAEPLGGDAGTAQGERQLHWMLDRALLGLCAIQVGVCEAATAQAAEYTSNREQFGKPLSTFQGAQLRAADAFIDTECIRVTTMQGAWMMDEGLDATSAVLVAKWWAAEAGQHAVHNTQHLHGGMGADVDYPIHRYFLWGKQIEDTLGGASATLARLGQVLAGA
jgi:alkylation response protein AidB-like acyl-CoA dehydrogenase